MGAIRPGNDDGAYKAFLRSRWPARTRLLTIYSAGGSLFFLLLDWVLTRTLPSPPSFATVLAVRLPWVVLPLCGMVVVLRRPRWRFLPLMVVALSLLYAWGNEWAYFKLGLAGTVMQAIAVVACCVTAATFIPLRMAGHAGVFALIALGQVAMDIAWPQARPLGQRLWTDAGVLAFVVVEIVLFQNQASNLRRGIALSAKLERALADLETSRREREGELQTRVQQALQEVKVLSGLLPICAWCKNVRNDAGYWQRIEAYVSDHSGASFTHSICPPCDAKAFGKEHGGGGK